jgi:hypothetical protein
MKLFPRNKAKLIFFTDATSGIMKNMKAGKFLYP